MSEQVPEPQPATVPTAGSLPATQEDLTRLRRLLETQQRKVDRLIATVIRGLVLVTVSTLVAGLMLPFFVPRKGEGRSATLWQALSDKDAPEVVDDTGGFWLIPILATLLVIGVALSFLAGAARGWLLGLRRFLAVGYLIGCLLGFLVLANADVSTRPAGAPPGLVTLTIGAVLAVLLSYTSVLGDLRESAGDPFR